MENPIRIKRKTHSWLIPEVCENLPDVNREVLLFKKFENKTNSQYHQANDNKLSGFAFKHCSHAKHGHAYSSILGISHSCARQGRLIGGEFHSLPYSRAVAKINTNISNTTPNEKTP
jgi:hypothetical protein